MMYYAFIFLGSYILTFICVFAWAHYRNNQAASRLREFGVEDKRLKNFHQQATPPFLFIQPTLVIGTFFGVVGSLIFWALIT